MMHHIQAKILEKLLYAEHLSYAAMRPEGVESNHFAYHLQQLIQTKLVVKQEASYTLTPQGLAYIDRLSHTNMRGRIQPHIITAIDITTSDGKTLLFKRLFQPYIFRVGFPLGKTHIDEHIAEAAKRELEEKSGLREIPLRHRGIVYIEAKSSGFTISKVLCHVFSGNIDTPRATTSSHRGSCQWADPKTYTESQLMPGFMEIKKLLTADTGFFFTEITADIEVNND